MQFRQWKGKIKLAWRIIDNEKSTFQELVEFDIDRMIISERIPNSVADIKVKFVKKRGNFSIHGTVELLHDLDDKIYVRHLIIEHF